MPTPLPYVMSYGKIKPLFDKIASAKVPDAFTQAYLSETLGMSSSGDRPLIPLLRALGLIDNAGKPSPDYASLKNSQKAGSVISQHVKEAYAALFAANEKAHTLGNEELKGLVAQVAGTDDEITKRTAATFRTLVEIAGKSAFDEAAPPASKDLDEEKHNGEGSGGGDKTMAELERTTKGKMRPEFHYNIQIHLPSNGSEETYLNIFNALRKALT